mmetsp:Transcript_6821/g.22072  ORF Transcript_6821/g.22072 Transcript_6821/m.22072 type:complete len:225 (+) Transcript_6821:1145-1819(+)
MASKSRSYVLLLCVAAATPRRSRQTPMTAKWTASPPDWRSVWASFLKVSTMGSTKASKAAAPSSPTEKTNLASPTQKTSLDRVVCSVVRWRALAETARNGSAALSQWWSRRKRTACNFSMNLPDDNPEDISKRSWRVSLTIFSHSGHCTRLWQILATTTFMTASQSPKAKTSKSFKKIFCLAEGCEMVAESSSKARDAPAARTAPIRARAATLTAAAVEAGSHI